MKNNTVIHVEKNNLIFRKSSDFLINWIKLYHNIGQKTLLLLSGGSVVRLNSDVTQFIKNSDLNFDFLTFAQVDERFQPENQEDINAYQIEKTGLWKVCKEKNIPYYLISQEGTLEKSGEQYDRTVEKLFKEYVYKVAVLGIGEDGHTAGLLPGYEKKWNKNKYIVGYRISQHRQNNAMALFCQGKRNFPQRISLTPKALKELDQALVVAVGENKKQSLQELLNGVKNENLNQFPAIIIRNISKVDLFTDLPIV